MSNVYTDWVVQQFMRTLRSYQKVKVPSDFFGQVDVIDTILKNDQSALIRTLYNFMVNAATVNYEFETGNENLDNRLNIWKENLNSGVAEDVPSGLRALSEQYFRERWRSSFLILNIQFEKVDKWWIPTKMWFMDGAQIRVEGDTTKLGGYTYHIGRKSGKQLKSIITRKIIIRKPYNMWHDQWPSPYMVSNGAIYHALNKILVLDKQSDLMAEVIPLMFLSKLGNDVTAKHGDLPTQPELKAHEKKIKEMQEAYKAGTTGFNAGTFPYDVDFKQDVPAIENFMSEKILKPSDRNILSAMGMIEMEGFSKSRQETVLNPKVMVEEVIDAVLDWRDMLQEVTKMTWEMNKSKHPKDTNRAIRVVPGLIRAFLTNDDKVLIRSAFDRGSIGHEDFVSIMPFDWKTSMKRRINERDSGLVDKLYPHVIMTQEQWPDDPDVDPESTNEESPEKKKSEKDVETSEIEDIKKLPRIQGIIEDSKKHPKEDKKKKKELIMAPFENIDSLPDSVKNVLPVAAQIIFLKAFNAAIEDGKSEEDAFKIAWGAVKKQYKKVPGKKKWVKK